MKKIYSLLIILIGIFMVNISKVDATCYKVCQYGSCNYEKELFPDKQCIHLNTTGKYEMYDKSFVGPFPGVQVDITECLNYLNYQYENVDDIYCRHGAENIISCGNLGKFNKKLPEISSWLITLLQVAVPVILIIMGVIDFVKSLSSQKDDEIKKNQQTFVKRVITAVIIFFVVVVVKLLVSLVSSGQTEKESIVKCIDCFISNKCE